MSAQSSTRVDDDFLGYRPEELVGRGGMGVVYRAHDVRLKRTVALKLMAPELAADDAFRERFEREAQLAMSLEHPNVVPIHDAGERDGRLYLVMRFVEGTDLRALLRAEGSLEPPRALAIVAQVAHALDAAHAKGLVHRDVKPSNVLLDADEHAYLADFGLTRPFGEGPAGAGHGRSLGTPAYLAPEQIEGRAIDGRADVYSLGCLLYECLTGTPPFAASSRLALAWSHLEEEPPRASERNATLPEAIDGVIRKAMAKEPEERHATCGELVAEAEAALGLRGRERRGRRGLLLAAAVVAAAVGAASLLVGHRGDAAATLGEPNQLIRVDPVTNEVAAVIDVGDFPGGVATAGTRVWVYSFADRSVSEVDSRTNEVVDTTPIGTVPSTIGPGTGPVLAADRGGAWVIGTAGDDAFVTRVLAGGGKRVQRLAGSLSSIAVGLGSGWVLGHDDRSDFIARLDPRTGNVIKRMRIAKEGKGSTPRLDGLTVGGGYVWAGASGLGALYRVDPASGAVKARDLGGSILRPVFGFGRVWVCVDGKMKTIDPATLRETRSGTGLHGEREYVPGFGSMWRHDGSSGTLMRFDERTGDVSGLTPLLEWNRHEVAVMAIAAGAGGIWLTVARWYS